MRVLLFILLASITACVAAGSEPGSPSVDAIHRLKVSNNHRYLIDAVSGQPVFLLADTAWNLGALRLEEVDAYMQSRATHGFNVVMFALNFFPQADEKNANGHVAYVGADKTELNPAYFEDCDAIIHKASEHGLYVMMYAMWAGKKSGTMNNFSAEQLSVVGQRLGERYKGVPNVIFCAGGESTPPYVDVERVNALGAGLKSGCKNLNLVTLHSTSNHSTSKSFESSSWLDFYMAQAQSSSAAKSTQYDVAALVIGDWKITPAKPTMMAEHRYESGTEEDPIIQRRSLYQCVFSGGCGHAYGHNALWQMTPHTAQPWMLKGWPPGVQDWKQALDTPAVRQLKHIKTLLYSHPYLERIPDQELVVAGQGADVATRIQATRDGTPGHNDATFLMAYLSARRAVTLNTAVIAAPHLNTYWFSPESGLTETIQEGFANPGNMIIDKRATGKDWVVVIEDSARHYMQTKTR